MTDSPVTKTAEQLRIDDDFQNIYWHDPVEGCWVAYRRTDCVGEEELPAGLLVSDAPSEEQIERAARAAIEVLVAEFDGIDAPFDEADIAQALEMQRKAQRAALTAAGVAPVLPSSGVDEDALAEVIEAEIDKLRHETRLYPDIYKAEVARAVVEWLKGQGW